MPMFSNKNMFLNRKCPVCGYNISSKPYYEREIKKIMKKLNPVKPELKAAVIKAINHLESDNRTDRIYYFLKAIENTDMIIIKQKCNYYIQDDRIIAGAKGLNWLKVVIRDEGLNKDKKLKYEKKIYGTSPPLFTILEEE